MDGIGIMEILGQVNVKRLFLDYPGYLNRRGIMRILDEGDVKK